MIWCDASVREITGGVGGSSADGATLAPLTDELAFAFFCFSRLASFFGLDFATINEATAFCLAGRDLLVEHLLLYEALPL